MEMTSLGLNGLNIGVLLAEMSAKGGSTVIYLLCFISELNGEVSSRESAYRELESALEILDECSAIEPAHYRLGSDPGTQMEQAQAEKGELS
jgi:hypothetical protein